MRILLTGATGYIGKRLLPALIEKGHYVICCVRDKNRFNPPVSLRSNIQVVEVDFYRSESIHDLPDDIDGAFYLMHSMSNAKNYMQIEQTVAYNFREYINQTNAQHVVYLSGIINEHQLSTHLASRKQVELELAKGNYHLTTLRSGIIIGSGSASFEIIRDLVEKLPVMITPYWLNTLCQPIGISDVIRFLTETLGNPITYDQNYDIGGPDILSYKEMLLGYATVRGLKRWIMTIPVMTPRLSSYWLYFVTSTSFRLAMALVDSMKVEVICRNDSINQQLQVSPLGYVESLERTLLKVESNQVVSSWKDSLVSGRFQNNISEFLQVPTYGCFIDDRSVETRNQERTKDLIWQIGGQNGWYYGNWLWRLRGFIDKLFGGVGLRRGRTNQTELSSGDAVDFWRVLFADRSAGRLLLFAEMKLPGEAWLEFRVEDNRIQQTATFRPKGLWGRLYWYAVLPFHGLIFRGLLNHLSQKGKV